MNSRQSGATAAVTGRADLLRAWLAHHRLVLVSTIRELMANPIATAMTWLMIGIALALPTILYVMLDNVSRLSGDWGGEPRISLYLDQATSEDEAKSLQSALLEDVQIRESEFVSSEAALKIFEERSGFGDVLKSLERNPLPHVLELTPTITEAIDLQELVSRLEKQPGVDRVVVDLAWLERLFAIVQLAERTVTALGVVLAAGVILVMGNTIRLAIENRRKEIEIIKLVGGTDAFVRRPFLYLGFWYGLGGALAAFLVTEISLVILSGPVENLAQSYRDEFALHGPGLEGTLILVLTGVVLGVLGALLAVGRHISEIEPQ